MARVTSPVFIGRLEELRLLEETLAHATREAARVVLLGGEAGVGKSRLVREFLARASGDARALVGGSFGVGGAAVPYAPIVDAVRRLLRETEPGRWPALLGPTRHELAILLPELADARIPRRIDDGDVGQGRIFGALLGLLERLGNERPTIFVLEDIHWADRATLDLVAYLAHGLDHERVLVLVTFRSDEVPARPPLRAMISRLERLEQVDRLDLAPLGATEIARLVEAIRGRGADADLIEEVAARSQGNPFFAEELVAAGQSGVALPRVLRDVLELRLETVPRRARRLLDLVSVAEHPVDEALLLHVSGFSRQAVAAALNEALDHGLLVWSEPKERGVQFRHALLAEAVRDRMLTDQRQDLHRAMASWLEERAASDGGEAELAGAIAHHWDAADAPSSALSWLIRAGVAAEASFAWAEADRHFGRALSLWDDHPTLAGPADRATVLGKAAEAAFGSGRYERAAQLGRAAVAALEAEGDPLRLARQLARLTQFQMWTRETSEALACADRALALVQKLPPSRERGEVLSWRAAILTFGLRFKDAEADAAEALAIARELGDTVTQGRALCVLGIAQAENGDVAEGLASLEEYRRIAIATDRPMDAARADFNRIALLVDDRRYEEALDVARAAVDLSIRNGLDRAMGDATQYWVGYCLMMLGRTDEADAVMRELLATVRDDRQRAEALALHGWILVRAGRADEADGPLGVTWRVDEHHPSDTSRYLMAHAESALVRARYEDALAVARRATAELDPLHHHMALSVLSVAGIVASIAAGRPDRETASYASELRAVAARCRRHPAACHAVTPAWAKLGEAEVERAAGRDHPRRWRASLRLLGALAEPYWQAFAGYRLAAAIIASEGPRSEAREALGTARRLAASLDAAPLLADIEGLARRARFELEGVSAGAGASQGRAPGGAPMRDIFALTAREADVLDCLAQGLADGEIAERLGIAKATASVHVMNIKQKLGASSRVEVVVRAIQDGLVEVAAR